LGFKQTIPNPTNQMPSLFMNKMRVSVPEGAVLTFLPDENGDPVMAEYNRHRIRFGIGGVWFETSEDVVMFIKDSFFATFHANPMNATADDTDEFKQRVLTGPPFDKAELFPLIFDFMVRKREDCQSVLRTVMLTPEQSRELDEIENFLFPCAEPLGNQRHISVTGPKFLLHPSTGNAMVAVLPAYRQNNMGDYVGEHGGDFVYHEHSGLCKDPRFVKLVADYQNSTRKKKHVSNPEMIQHLNTEYGIDSKPITEDVIRHCEIVRIKRGEPFAVMSDEESGTCFLSVLTELDGSLDWSVA